MCVLCDVQLKQLGHSVDKVEFIVMGGTFMALPEEYRDYFIRNLHDALSGHTSNNVAEAVRYSAAAGFSLCPPLCLMPTTRRPAVASIELYFYSRTVTLMLVVLLSLTQLQGSDGVTLLAVLKIF